jgi:hypothetical protein
MRSSTSGWREHIGEEAEMNQVPEFMSAVVFLYSVIFGMIVVVGRKGRGTEGCSKTQNGVPT